MRASEAPWNMNKTCPHRKQGPQNSNRKLAPDSEYCSFRASQNKAALHSVMKADLLREDRERGREEEEEEGTGKGKRKQEFR